MPRPSTTVRIACAAIGLFALVGAGCSSSASSDDATKDDATTTTASAGKDSSSTVVSTTTGATTGTTTNTRKDTDVDTTGTFEAKGACGQVKADDGKVYELVMGEATDTQVINADGELKVYTSAAVEKAVSGDRVHVVGIVSRFDSMREPLECPDADLLLAYSVVDPA